MCYELMLDQWQMSFLLSRRTDQRHLFKKSSLTSESKIYHSTQPAEYLGNILNHIIILYYYYNYIMFHYLFLIVYILGNILQSTLTSPGPQSAFSVNYWQFQYHIIYVHLHSPTKCSTWKLINIKERKMTIIIV